MSACHPPKSPRTRGMCSIALPPYPTSPRSAPLGEPSPARVRATRLRLALPQLRGVA